jgi:hypothetical protein
MFTVHGESHRLQRCPMDHVRAYERDLNLLDGVLAPSMVLYPMEPWSAIDMHLYQHHFRYDVASSAASSQRSLEMVCAVPLGIQHC